jgi:hypothetical protein
VTLFALAAGCAAARGKNGPTTREVIERGVDAGAGAIGAAASGNYLAAARFIWNYGAWLVAAGTTTAAGAAGVKVRRLTRPWNPNKDGERRTRRRPPAPPAPPDDAPPAAPAAVYPRAAA